MTESEGGGGRTSSVGQIDRHWLVYVVALSLAGVWLAALLELISHHHPLQAQVKDGSLIIFCFVTVWLTFGALNQELKKGQWDRKIDRAIWVSRDRYMGFGVAVTVTAGVLYGAVVFDDEMSDGLKIGCSAFAVLAGVIFARLVIGTHDKVVQRSLRDGLGK